MSINGLKLFSINFLGLFMKATCNLYKNSLIQFCSILEIKYAYVLTQ